MHHYPISTRSTKLTDQTFANYLYGIINRFDISHMISSDDLSTFELVSESKKERIILHVAIEQDFEDFINSFQGEQASPIILDRIKQKLAIPCFPDRNIPDGTLWAEYMKPVRALHGENSYYISCYTKNEGISLHAI